MNDDVPRVPRLEQVTATGSALAGALLPLMAGVLLAKSLGADPMTPVNAFVTGGGQRVRVCRAYLRGSGRDALCRLGPAVSRVRPAAGRPEHGAPRWRPAVPGAPGPRGVVWTPPGRLDWRRGEGEETLDRGVPDDSATRGVRARFGLPRAGTGSRLYRSTPRSEG
jgi:hypothetical protein